MLLEAKVSPRRHDRRSNTDGPSYRAPGHAHRIRGSQLFVGLGLNGTAASQRRSTMRRKACWMAATWEPNEATPRLSQDGSAQKQGHVVARWADIVFQQDRPSFPASFERHPKEVRETVVIYPRRKYQSEQSSHRQSVVLMHKSCCRACLWRPEASHKARICFSQPGRF